MAVGAVPALVQFSLVEFSLVWCFFFFFKIAKELDQQKKKERKSCTPYILLLFLISFPPLFLFVYPRFEGAFIHPLQSSRLVPIQSFVMLISPLGMWGMQWHH